MSNDNKTWHEVFSAYPDAEEIYVCGGQPFLDKHAAGNHARTIGEEIETVKRPVAKTEAPVKKLTAKEQKAAEKKAAAEKAAAEKAEAEKAAAEDKKGEE